MIVSILKSKWVLFSGLGLLITGIILRIALSNNPSGLVLILSGVGLKTAYIIAKARSGEYQPGKELLYLFIGLVLFLAGLYLKYHNPPFSPAILIIPGISLKVLFIIMFIRKTKKSNQ